MPDYKDKELYLKLFRASEDAINILIEAQRVCEAMYLEQYDPTLSPHAAMPKVLHIREDIPLDAAIFHRRRQFRLAGDCLAHAARRAGADTGPPDPSNSAQIETRSRLYRCLMFAVTSRSTSAVSSAGA